MIQTDAGTKKSLAYAGTFTSAIQETRSSTAKGGAGAVAPHIFRLARTPYLRTLWRTTLMVGVLLASALLAALFAAWLAVSLPTYAHTFAPYLKWVLVASLCYLALLCLLGCAMLLRFFIALRLGHRQGMVTLVTTDVASASRITVRDLSALHLSGIRRALYMTYACYLAVLTGLLPLMGIGWTIHLPHPVLAVLATAAVIVLAIAGLVIVLPSFSFIVIGWIGCISFTRKLGAPHTYTLTNAATLTIDDFALVISYPDAPEAAIDLNLLDPVDQGHLLYLLRTRWLDAQCSWNPRLGEEIEGALKEAQHFTTLV